MAARLARRQRVLLARACRDGLRRAATMAAAERRYLAETLRYSIAPAAASANTVLSGQARHTVSLAAAALDSGEVDSPHLAAAAAIYAAAR